MNRYDLQSYALLALNRLRRLGRPSHLPLLAPPCLLHTGGNAVSNLYKEIFVARAYAAPRPLPSGARILDAGAHIGLASIFFLHTYPGARVVAVEANPTTAALLERNLARWRGRVEIVKKALTDHGGSSSFFVTTDTPANVNAGLSNRERTDASVSSFEVPCVDVATLLDEPVDFAKIDIEGAEYEVLMAERFVPERVRAAVIELHDVDVDRDRAERVLRSLTEDRGYVLSGPRGPVGWASLLDGVTSSGALCRIEAPR